MKIVLATVLALCFAAAVLASSTPVINEAMINQINSNPASTWKAGVNKIFEGKTLEEVRHMLGAFLIVPESDRIVKTIYDDSVALPDSFDSKKQWPNCAHDIRNQARCGSCWAFSAAEVLTDRFCIATNGAVNVILSPQDLVSCDKSNYGCQGGYLDRTWQYLTSTGIVSDACMPYTAANGFVAQCPTTCPTSGQTWKKYKAASGTTVHFGSASSMQQAIQAKGPIQVGFRVYQDFFNYKSGVYTHHSGGLAGGHAVKIDGWGVDSNNVPYWIVANSWGTTWGQAGYFWIKRGNDECGIEDQSYTADPQV